MRFDDEYQGVSYAIHNSTIYVDNNMALARYLATPGNSSAALAAHLLQEYEDHYGRRAKITLFSLATEITCHVAIDKFALGFDWLLSLPDVLAGKPPHGLDSITSRTGVIDCGPASSDTNRVVWDMLAPFGALLGPLLGI